VVNGCLAVQAGPPGGHAETRRRGGRRGAARFVHYQRRPGAPGTRGENGGWAAAGCRWGAGLHVTHASRAVFVVFRGFHVGTVVERSGEPEPVVRLRVKEGAIDGGAGEGIVAPGACSPVKNHPIHTFGFVLWAICM
jgi:hypothetical protein